MTANWVPPPLAATVATVGETVKAQATAGWVTVIVCPATATVPDRDVLVSFPDAETRTEPLPVPEATPENVRNVALLDDVQLQPAPTSTVMGAFPPLVGMLVLVGETLNEQLLSCVIVTVCPAIVTEPERAASALARADTVIVPEPVPCPLVISRKPLLLPAVHVQFEPCVLVTVSVTPPPPAGMLAVVGETV